jgi:DNA-binding NtrC family response regulator
MSASNDPTAFATASGASTVREVDERTVEEGVLHLIVMGANIFSMHPLPEAGMVTIGRDDDDDVRIDDANASRHHARLHVGTVLQIEDLGSTNGTRLRGNLLPPGQRAPVLAGEAISIGWATLMIQRRRPTVRVRRIPTHAYFEGRLEEECDKASSSGRVFAVLRLHVAPGTSPEAVGEIVSPQVRPGDVLASYGPDEYEMILFEHDAKRVSDFAARIVSSLGARNLAARTGVAFFPGDARSADGLIARACERVQGRNISATPSSDDIRCGPEMRRVHLLAKRAAVSNINVLVVGETGVGKEVLAEIIHGLSPRAGKPFVRINCAALSSTLFEAELFGHDRGAFTDAREAKPGLLETADGGTVFLDEIGELPLPLQAKLLRVLEAREVRRIGSAQPRKINVRVIAATNRDLREEVNRGSFRQDLYFRLEVMRLRVPPLRERPDDIPVLVEHFRTLAKPGAAAPPLSEETLRNFVAHPWPGNVRELRNAVERLTVLDDMPFSTSAASDSDEGGGDPADIRVPFKDAKNALTDRFERRYLTAMLEATGGNISEAARRAGIDRVYLLRLMGRYGLRKARE